MTTGKNIIAVNDTTSDIYLGDLGINVPASSQVSLHEQFEFSEIANADPLKVQVAAGNIIINDGFTNLSIADGLNYIDYWGKYEYQSEQSFIEAFERVDQFLDEDDTFKFMDISNLDVDPVNAHLDGTSTIVLEIPGTYFTSYQINCKYTGNAVTILYTAGAEVNDTDIERVRTVGWTRYSDSELTLTTGVHIKDLKAGDRIKIKLKASRNVENITVGFVSALVKRIYD